LFFLQRVVRDKIANAALSIPDPQKFSVFEPIPSEISFDWIYLPPLLVAVVLGCLCAYGTTRLLRATGLSRFFWHSGLTFLGFWVLVTSLIGLIFMPP
jgi:ABC-type multidrug transport system permease subunit